MSDNKMLFGGYFGGIMVPHPMKKQSTLHKLCLFAKYRDLTFRRQLPDILWNMRLRYCEILTGSSTEHPIMSTIKLFSKH